MTDEGAADADYEAAKRLANDSDPDRRRALAARPEIAPEILYYLAADVAAEVRAAIAANPSTPLQADLILADDAEEAVRGALVPKTIARLPANGDPRGDDGPLERLVAQVLARLAADRSVAVRRALAEAIRDHEHAPREVVVRLARDALPAVADPVLRHSPQLGDEDLVAIVEAPGAPGALCSIARRGAVSARVADAIAGTDDVEAVAALLANHGAQIREATLDRILIRAPSHESWHRPLVYRPDLSGAAVRSLSRFVALSLVEALQKRSDLDPETGAIVAEMLNVRRELDGRPTAAAADAAPAPAAPQGADRARALAAEGALDAEAIDDAIFAGDRPFVVAAVAVLAGVDEEVAERVFRSASGKGTVALAWKAGLGMGMAVKLQHQIAHVPARSVLRPHDGGLYPLTEEDMVWQLEFFGAAG